MPGLGDANQDSCVHAIFILLLVPPRGRHKHPPGFVKASCQGEERVLYSKL
jgi:hypothetical protein